MTVLKTVPSAAGYSGKPLYQKLGLKPGMRCVVMTPPEHYDELVDGVEGVRFQKSSTSADVVHLFCRRERDLVRRYARALASLADGGMLWVSWPKKTSSLYQDLTEDGVRSVLLPTGWVDVKVCAVDQDWSGLKFLKRKAPKKNSR